MNEKIPVEIILNIIKKTSPYNLYKICSQNKHYSEICKNNFNVIAKYYLDKYEVNYTDPGNFIYKYNNTNINNFKNETGWNYSGLFRLYMKMFNEYRIRCNNMNITSFPIYPNMIEFYGDNNKLKTFPIQPKMEIFSGDNNQLTTFPIQPEMIFFNAVNNHLSSFPIQPKMEVFNGDKNYLRSFPIQPKMEIFSGDDNQLTSFPIQPKMTTFSADNNPVILDTIS